MTADFPDFVQTVQPSRVQPHAGQSRDYYVAGGTLSAGSYTAFDIGTAGSDEQWLIAFINVSVSKSCICRVRLYTNEFGGAYYFYDSYFDIRHHVAFPESGMFPGSAGGTISAEIYNYGASSADIRFSMHSTKVKV